MRGGQLAGVAAGIWLAGAGAAPAQNAVSFPPTLDRDAILAWLSRETDITPERVIAVTPQALTSVVSSFPAGPGAEPRIVIRAEALNAETYTRTGTLSWHVSMSADCKGRRVRLGDTTGYQDRNLLGDRKPLRAAETEWRAPGSGTALDAALRSVCDKDFKGPFQGTAMMVAKADAGAAPAATVAPPAPAPASAKPPSPPITAAASAPAKAPAAPAKSPPAKPSGVVVQVGSSPSESDAKSILAALRPRLNGRTAWVETAEVNGKTWRRAVVGGFVDGAEATRFCTELRAAGRNCFVRGRGA